MTFQKRVVEWLMACFSMEVCRDGIERNHRFLEEALELVQSLDCTRSEAHQLVDYVFDRPVGEPMQELGGTLVTLTALANCHDMDMMQAGETELARVWTKIDKIRAKQAAKPKHSPLPQHVPVAQAVPDPSWRCFHCGEVFTDPKAAANHFGVDHVGDETLCQMAQVDGGIARVIADLAEELQRYRSEDNTSYREFYALGADHRAALIKEEQRGYDRGLADARAEASPMPSADRGPTEPLKCLRCGTVDAFGPVKSHE